MNIIEMIIGLQTPAVPPAGLISDFSCPHLGREFFLIFSSLENSAGHNPDCVVRCIRSDKSSNQILAELSAAIWNEPCGTTVTMHSTLSEHTTINIEFCNLHVA